ncbi:hypothetical protein [Kordia sp.]|uniref:hypothetical protein n=1 Tax=Kordia sp. TaxID=1965332 RepID=UPI003D6B4D5C
MSEGKINFTRDYDKTNEMFVDIEKSRSIWPGEINQKKLIKTLTTKCFDEPFYLYDQIELENRIKTFFKYFKKNKSNRFVAYAIKANPHNAILNTLATNGINSFDCASPMEIVTIQKIFQDQNLSPPTIFYNHPEKSVSDIKESIKRGVHHFTTDTIFEVDRIFSELQSGKEYEIVVRISPKLTVKSEAQIALSEKFGATIEKGKEIIEHIDKATKQSGMKVNIGVSTHIGSQNFRPDIHCAYIEEIVKVIKETDKKITVFNYGGGIPVNQFKGQKENMEILENYLSELDKISTNLIEPLLGENGKIIIEPGRGMVCTCIDLMIPISRKRKRDGKYYLWMRDGIFTSFSDYTIHKWKFPFEAMKKSGKKLRSRKVNFTLFGRTSHEKDFVENVFLPRRTKEGHYLWVSNAGAYHSAQASYFESHPVHRYVIYRREEELAYKQRLVQFFKRLLGKIQFWNNNIQF